MNAVIIVYEIRVNYIKLSQWAWKQWALYEIMHNIWENIMKYNSLQAKFAKRKKAIPQTCAWRKVRDHGYMPETSRHKTCLFVIFKEVNHLSSKYALRFYVCTSHNINSLVHATCVNVCRGDLLCLLLHLTVCFFFFCAVALILLYFCVTFVLFPCCSLLSVNCKLIFAI